VHTILSWLQQLIAERMADGGLKVAAPLQSTIHGVLADAMIGYENCKYATLALEYAHRVGNFVSVCLVAS
jgi:hypothetical protein